MTHSLARRACTKKRQSLVGSHQQSWWFTQLMSVCPEARRVLASTTHATPSYVCWLSAKLQVGRNALSHVSCAFDVDLIYNGRHFNRVVRPEITARLNRCEMKQIFSCLENIPAFRLLLQIVLILTSLSGGTLAAQESWWQFRGPNGNGHTTATNLPLDWGESRNVAWKTAIHDRGWSSPVLWGNQVWLTTATRDGHRLFAVCVDKDTGKIVHDLHVFDVEDPMRITDENTYATPTPVIEEGRVFIHYGTYGTACLDTATGRKLWTRRDLNCDHEAGAGPASSPTLIDGNVVVHVDGRDVQYIIALDRDTGKTVWKTPRSIDFTDIPVHHRKAFCMPIVIPRGDGKQVVSPGGRAVYSYDLKGRELWRIQHRGFSVAPRPVFGHNLVFTIIDRDRPELWAVRPDGNGDVTDTHLAWKLFKSMPQRCSPLLVGDLLFLVNRAGIATCVEAKTGKPVWKERFRGRYSASPIYAENRIYLFNEYAMTTVIRPGRKLDVIATNALAKQPLLATPAVDGTAFVIRTEDYLYRIENGANKLSGL